MIRWKKMKGGLALTLAALMLCQPLGVYAEEFTAADNDATVVTDANGSKVKEESGDAENEIGIAEENDTLLSATANDALASGSCGENLTWILDHKGTLTISGSGKMEDDLYEAPWRSYASDIKKVILSEGVTSIGAGAFTDCSSLSSITLPKSLTSILSWAFDGCSSLSSVSLPNSVTELGTGVFNGCRSLSSVNIPKGVIIIRTSTFEGCSSLKNIDIPDGVVSIWEYAFKDCSSLTSMSIPSSVTGVGEGAFEGCSNLKNIYFSGSQAEWSVLQENVLYGFTTLPTVYIGGKKRIAV